MFKTEYKLEYSLSEDKELAAVIVVCGGSSSRMNNKDKMLLEIKGVPVFIRSLLAFEKNSGIGKIIVVTRAENLLTTQNAVKQFGITKVTDIVVGGKSRQESVKCGFDMLTKDDKICLIHDGARPFVTNDCITRVIEGANFFGAVSCVVQCKDTIKKIDNHGKVVETPNRSSLVSVQTPQGFKTEIYKNALEKCGDLSSFTDDCSIVESVGVPVYTVEGDYTNIKITTPEDVLLAEAILKECDEQ